MAQHPAGFGQRHFCSRVEALLNVLDRRQSTVRSSSNIGSSLAALSNLIVLQLPSRSILTHGIDHFSFSRSGSYSSRLHSFRGTAR